MATMRDLLPGVGAGIGGFFAWWGGELAQMVPAGIRRGLAADEARLRVELAGELVRVVRPNGGAPDGGAEVLGELPPPVDPAALRSLLRRAGAGPKGVTLRLTGARAIRRQVELPAAAEENLGEVLAFDLDRLTPFRRADVYLAWRIVARDRAARRITVDLEVAPRPVVDAALAAARGLGLAPGRVEVAPVRSGDEPLDLLPPAPVSAAARWHARINLVLAVLVAGLGGALVLGELDRQQAEARALAAEVAAARERAEAVLRLEEEAQILRTSRGYAVHRREERPLLAELLDEIAQLLPDHTYLLEAHLRDGQFELVGYSNAVSELVDGFSASPLFSEVRFLAPVTRDGRENLDRFSLGLRIGEWRRGEARVDAPGRRL